MILFLLFSACSPGSDDWTSPTIGQALDYTLDHTRVLALRVDPPIVRDGQEVELEALVLGPDTVDSVVLDGCGLLTDERVVIYGAECFGNESLVFPIGDGRPTQWQVPQLNGPAFADCPLDGSVDSCISSFPVRASSTGSEDDVAQGTMILDVQVGREAASPVALQHQDLTLVMPTNASAGDVVELSAQWIPEALPLPVGETTFVFPEVRWYVDGGTLANTARTSPTLQSDGSWGSTNRLHLPDDASGSLRVVAILHVVQTDPYQPSSSYTDTAWRVQTLQVTP